MKPRTQIDPFSVLSLEIVAEILAKANVRSVLRFRCVSKSLRSLISSEQFIASHLQISTISTTISDQTLISYYVKLMTSGIDYPLLSSVYDIFAGDEDQDVPVAGHCSYSNGLCCLFVDKTVCRLWDEFGFRLWNPSKREHYTLPSSVVLSSHERTSMMMYGFGHDKGSGDYKVFADLLCKTWDEINDERYESCVAKIYSLKKDSWEEVENFPEPNDFPENPCGKLIGTKLHWCFIDKEKHVWNIICFDLSTIEHGFVELPNLEDGILGSSVEVFKECLCVLAFCSVEQKCCIDVWIMRQYGVKESWYKAFRLPFEQGLHNVLRSPGHYPWCVTQDLEILCSTDNSQLDENPVFEFYNPKTDSYRPPQIGNGNGVSRDENLQSLVSPFPKKARLL